VEKATCRTVPGVLQALFNHCVDFDFTCTITTFQDLSRHHLLSTDLSKSAFTAVMSPSSNKLFPGQNPPQRTDDDDEIDDLSKVGEGRSLCVFYL
jgi:hypothetical protein